MTTRLDAMRVGAGLSTRRSGLAATEDALDAALRPLDGAIPDLAFLFIAPQFEDELESIVNSANASLGGGTLLGCVAGGVIGGEREVEDAPAVAAWAATLPGVAVRPFTLTYAEEEEHGVFEGLEEVPTRTPDSVLVMLADPYTFPAHLLLDHLNEHAPGLPVVGGMASGGIVAGRTRLIADDEIFAEGAVGAIIEGAHGATAVVSQGCRPVGETFAITRAERNVVFELGGQPALQRVEELYANATERDQLLMRRGLHVGQAASELKAELGRGDFVIRNLVGVDRDTGAIAISDMAEVGQTVQFQVRDAESAREDLRAMLEHQRASPVAGALLFSCNGRGQGLFGQPDHDVGAVRRAFGEIPVAGFFAAGELGPVAGRNFVHGFTASLLLFRNGGAPKL
ncbi:MAG TPA: FIST N-terminal domain-containing protein [Candidatus Limnocylindria bacterium]|jgi:small ligand-binding sensory domain FIST|nr:FIST N-terminal domain-containing protein [Candidatus Limnocylindria bacterium]